MIFIDTNIFLEIQFQDSRWEECRNFLKKVEDGKIEALTTDFIIYTIINIENKKRSISKIKRFLAALSGINVKFIILSLM